MGLDSDAARSLARRFSEVNDLHPPVNVEALVRENADLFFCEIPVAGVDGVTLHLKVPGKRARVIVNTKHSEARQRFTLAHELGHIVIPWHTGMIVDQFDDHATLTPSQRRKEAEANIFASEILIPESWLQKAMKGFENLADLQGFVSDECQVSMEAAARRLIEALVPGAIYAMEAEKRVRCAIRSEGTLAEVPTIDAPLDTKAYSYRQSYSSCKRKGQKHHWWVLPISVSLSIKEDRTWQALLETIVCDAGLEGPEAARFKQQVSGVIGSANSKLRQQKIVPYSAEAVVAACLQRLQDRSEPEYAALTEHDLFEAFVMRRCEALARPKKKRKKALAA